KEVERVSKVLKSNTKPVTALGGGAKVSSKMIIIESSVESIEELSIGGGMVFTFIKALGGKVGNSLVEDDFLATAKEILEKAKAKNVTVLLPEDSVVSTAFNNESEVKIFDTNNIPDGWMGLDIGEKAIAAYSNCIKNSKTILWNGPMGVFEMSN